MSPFCKHILLFSLLLIALVAKAQAPLISEKSLDVNTDYAVETWNSENGLPQNSIINIFQTHDGFLWIATFNGLLRYDGIILKLFNTLNTPGLPINSIRNFVEDKNNVLWLLATNGKLLKYYKGIFETIIIDNDENNSVRDICENENGELVVGTKNNKIFHLNGMHFSLLVKLPNDSIKLTKVQPDLLDGSLQIGTTKGLYIYKNKQLVLVPEVKGKVLQIKKDPNNKLWVYTNSGLFRIINGIYSEYKLPEKLNEPEILTDFYVEKMETSG